MPHGSLRFNLEVTNEAYATEKTNRQEIIMSGQTMISPVQISFTQQQQTRVQFSLMRLSKSQFEVSFNF